MTINTHNRALVNRVLQRMHLHREYMDRDVLDEIIDAARAEGPVQAACPVCQRLAGGKCLGSPECPMAATPPADEVGRAVERLAANVEASGRETISGVCEVMSSDLALILSHVSRLEGLAFDRLRGWSAANEATRKANDRADVLAASLKLAVEALEPFAKAADDAEEDVDPASAFRDDEWLCQVDDDLTIGDVRRAREALRSISSLRHEDMPLAPGGDVEASRQSGGEG